MSLEFRAWDKKRKMMIGNDLLFVLANNAEYSTVDETVSIKNGLQNPYRETDKNNELEMDLEFMQYTGLKDKNGVKIYFGDILATRNDNPEFDIWNLEDNGYTIVKEKKYELGVGYTNWMPTNDDESIFYFGFVEVIGNIYENPELLEQMC